MLIEYSIKFHPDGLAISQRVEPDSPAGPPDQAGSDGSEAHNSLGRSIAHTQGGVPNPPTGPHGKGGVPNPPIGPHGKGGVPNPPTGPHGKAGVPNPPTGPHGLAGNGNGTPAIVFGPIIIGTANGNAHPVGGQDISEFQMQPQLESNWCWAAVSVSVERYFAPQSSLSQCQLAGKLLGRNDCCLGSAACNQPEFLEDALDKAGRPPSDIKPPLGFDDIRQQIDAGKPVCARIAWDGGPRGHFVVICGYHQLPTGEQLVDVADPFYSGSTVDFQEFATAYQGSGQWTDAYLV
ncbi:MAG TPA: papain-like cysteine protease family protein [Bryobacteraceae bacterium]|nr:papain-like cysteine protease family protein [Bryobacteraceae bacterium]